MTSRMGDQAESRLRDAVERVYRVFAGPCPPKIEGCPCCIATRGVDVLLTTPLRDITGEALWRYVSGAFLTVGDARDFRYLLPRILEISAFDTGNANDPQIVLGKLSLAGWQAWLPAETHTIRDFIDAWFEQALVTDLSDADEGWGVGCAAEAVLCGAARAGLSLTPWLGRLREPDAAPVLIEMKDRLSGGPSGFWQDAPAGWRALQAILT